MGAMGAAKLLARDAINYAAVRLGRRHSETRLAGDSRAYWNGEADDTWRNNSHWPDGSAFTAQSWAAIGIEHRELFDRLARTTPGYPRSFERVVEWGCGGGTNVVAFAGLAGKELVGVDIDQRTLDVCQRQVETATDTPFRPVLADVDQPNDAAAEVGECDLYLSFYVLELVPSPAYGLKLMDLAYAMLSPGGLAFVQIKYDTGSWRTRSKLRGYRESTAAGMTTYRIDEFWTAMTEIGFTPEAVYVVPETPYDERYAYFLLRK